MIVVKYSVILLIVILIKFFNISALITEVGCEIWDVLCGVKEALYEPVGLWMPAHDLKS